ncbi:IS3 family transposase [Bacillus sp. REN16]|nr:IS3 family transposase [Bacillus sp. REN16]MCC3358989.1 IS3 family transposase [Bacillus sp. REN16]
MCDVLSVSKSGFYAWKKRTKSTQKIQKEKLTAEIKKTHLESRSIYGSKKSTKVLNRKCIPVSQKTVSRIMQEEGIRPKTVKKCKATTNSKH